VRLAILRFDHAGVVEDLDAVTGFFLGLVFEREGGTLVEGEAVEKINGRDGVRADIVMVRTPNGSGKLELVKYHTPADDTGPHALPANQLGGEVCDYGNIYRLCYFADPKGSSSSSPSTSGPTG
jgi:hypothetical protein